VKPRHKIMIRNFGRETAWHLVLGLFGISMLVPFLFALSTSLKETGKEFTWPPQWIPDPVVWYNYVRAMTVLPFHLFVKNTLIITLSATAGSILTASLAGFAFARLRFPARTFLFGLCLSSMMLPYAVTMIPQFILFMALGWVNTLLPLTVPSWFGGGAFFIFLCRQFFMTIPYEYDDAARIDGAGEWQIWARVMLPLSRPVIATIAVFSFVNHWNDFMGPLIYLHSMEKRTIAVGLRTYLGMEGTDWNYLMAAAVASTIPILILFFSAQRYFIKGVVMSGLAGR
jgi:multiple sugar transport system permease protein